MREGKAVHSINKNARNKIVTKDENEKARRSFFSIFVLFIEYQNNENQCQ